MAGSATNLCNLFPIGIGNATVAGVAIGGTVSGVVHGIQPTNFDWLTWAGNRSESTLLTSLTPPGNSSTYVNPSNSSDHSLDPGDSVNGDPLMPDDSSMTSKLNTLKTLDITVPVFDQGNQNGDVRTLRVIGFASLRLTAFDLHHGTNPQTITFTYKGSVSCSTGNATLTLSPSVAGPNVTGTIQQLAATLHDRAGNPISGVTVTFTVTGANATSGSATTNSSGQASFTYTGAASGTDSIQATTTVSSFNVLSNTASIAWVTPIQTVSTSPVWGRFFAATHPVDFGATPSQTPDFSQVFPSLNFDPPPSTVPGNTSGVNQGTRPVTEVTTDINGNYTGTVIAQGNGEQAGIGNLFEFNAVFTGTFTVTAAGNVTFNFWHDDGFILGIGNGVTYVSGPLVHVPASGLTAFQSFPVVGANYFAVVSSPDAVTVHFPAPGTYPYEIDWNECCGDGLNLAVTVATPGGTVGIPQTESLVLSPNTNQALTAGGQQSFTVTATDAAGHPVANQAVQLAVSGANAQQVTGTTNASGQATLSYTGSNPGTDTVQATAWVINQATFSPQVTVTWNPQAQPPAPPIATPGWIGSPASQSTLTQPTPITLANGITLSTGTVDYWPTSNPSAVTTLATNVSGGGGATLATFDTTTLANGSYIVRLQGTDTSNTKLNSEILVTVAGQYKPGRFTVTLTDLTVPVTGLPITIGRTYDSLLRNQVGDFGYGWTLALGNPKLTVDPAFNVTLTMPDGRRITFYFTPQSAGGVLGFLLLPAYTPEPGVYGTLTAQGCGLLALSSGQYFCFPGTPYQPTSYTYTDPYGRAYVLSPSGTLQSITDLDGNTLNFSANGITSSAGNLNVPFVRDSAGRITKITDPLGNVYSYSYDANGNLTSITLPGVATPITQTYDATNLLLTIKDPRGNQAVVTTYDSSGRVQSLTDALGNKTSYSYNLSTNTTTMTAPDGGVSTYTYDSYGMLLSVTDPLGHTTSYTYDSKHNLLTQTDPLNNTTTYTYDSQGNRTSATDPLGNVVSATYNQFGGPITLKDALGATWTVSYDALFHPTGVSDSLGTVGSYTWDTHGQPLTRADANGKVTSYTYDQYGNLLTQTDPLGNVTTSTYDLLGRTLTEKDARGNTTTYTYDALGHVLTVKDALGSVTTNTYDANGNLLTTTDALGHQTSYTYDVLNHLIKTTYPDTTTTQTTYDFRGHPLTQTDQLGRVTTSVYDLLGQLTSVTVATGTADVGTTSYTYDAAGHQTKVTDPLGHSTTTTYDALGQVLSVTDPLGHATTYTYTADGQQASVTDANGHKTTFTYDLRGRLTKTTYPDGTTTLASYDGVGNLLSSTDQAGLVTSYTYDLVGRLLSVTDPLSHTTSYTYDAVGNLLTITDANTHQTSFTYDALNRQTKKTWPDGSFELFSYDAVGNQTSHQLADGHVNTSAYDVMNRLVTLTYFDGTSVSYTYTATGQRATVVDGRGTTSYTYDNRDRLIKITVPSGLTVSYTYDAADNRASMVTAAGTTSYTYDAANRLASVAATGVGTTTYGYDNVGNRTLITLPNTVSTSYVYDSLNRLTSVTEMLGSQVLASYTYTLGAAGNRTKVVEGNGNTTSWSYDNAYRLTNETTKDQGGNVLYQASYTYDAVGNRLSSTINGQQTSYSYNTLDQLTSANTSTYQYDGRGNLLKITNGTSSITYTYDAADRLVSAIEPNGTSASYGYDADGRRVKQTVGTTVTNYLWDEASVYGDVVLETDGSGTIQASYVLGEGQLLAQTRSGTTSYFLDDGQGNVRDLTNSSGAITDQYTYDAFGNVLSAQGTTTNAYRYTGQQLDSLTGLYSLRARYYDPTSGRFLSRDTAGVDFSNPLELDRYSYTHDNPINFLDPTGHAAAKEYEDILTLLLYVAAGAAIGGGIAALPKDILRKILEGIADFLKHILAALLGFSLGGLISGFLHKIISAVRSKSNNPPSKQEVLLDTNAVYNYALAQAQGAIDLSKEEPVICQQTWDELVQNQNKLHIPGYAYTFPIVPNQYDYYISTQLRQLLNYFQPTDQGRDGDVIIGTTALVSHRPLVTGDIALYNAVLQMGGDVRFVAHP